MREMSAQFEASEQWKYGAYNPYMKFLIGKGGKKIPHVLQCKKKKKNVFVLSRHISFLFENLLTLIGLDISG
jgi:hypothetical protein